jgi:acetyl esterase/lipase
VLARRSLLRLAAAVPALAVAGCGAPARGGRESVGAVTSEHRYGDDAIQVADLLLPADPDGSPVVVLVHGGFWSSAYDRSLEVEVAGDLVAAGYAVWNLDYRSVGNGGGFPATFDDVAAGVDLLAEVAPEHALDLARVGVVGHSAGGHMALWAAARHLLPAGASGADPVLRPAAVVSQAGVNDLVAAHRDGLGGGAVAAFLGTGTGPLPGDVVAVTSPAALVPTGVPTLVVTGDRDDRVPAAQSEDYAEVARAAGDDVTLEVVAGEGHFEHLDPASGVWSVTRGWLDARLLG